MSSSLSELKEACWLGYDALVAIGPIRSERTRGCLCDVHDGWVSHGHVPVVADFLAQARPLLLVQR